MRVPEQSPLAIDVARWQGEPVAVVVAATRAQAEDAVERIAVEWEPLPAVVDPFIGATSECPVIHGALGSNVVYDGTVAHGDMGATMEVAALVVESEFLFGRHTGVCLEARSILADYRASDETLTVYESHQCPAQQQDIFARLLGLSDNKVRVVCADVGGAFGIEQQLYGDEIVVCIFSRILRRPVKFVADRLESFTSDVHAPEQASCGSGSSAFWPTIARNSGGTGSFAHGIAASCDRSRTVIEKNDTDDRLRIGIENGVHIIIGHRHERREVLHRGDPVTQTFERPTSVRARTSSRDRLFTIGPAMRPHCSSGTDSK
jgi:hypothetical protein